MTSQTTMTNQTTQTSTTISKASSEILQTFENDIKFFTETVDGTFELVSRSIDEIDDIFIRNQKVPVTDWLLSVV